VQLLIESTDTITVVDGRPTRLWKGVTEGWAALDAGLTPIAPPPEALTPLRRIAPAGPDEAAD
jgi:hypothetical protein